jgi:hypothetical protein
VTAEITAEMCRDKSLYSCGLWDGSPFPDTRPFRRASSAPMTADRLFVES